VYRVALVAVVQTLLEQVVLELLDKVTLALISEQTAVKAVAVVVLAKQEA
jgi:hypothetical protein